MEVDLSDKLRNILTLALWPETGDGEAAAVSTLRRRLGTDVWDGSVSYTTRAKSC
jgi:hypothetical protein